MFVSNDDQALEKSSTKLNFPILWDWYNPLFKRKTNQEDSSSKIIS